MINARDVVTAIENIQQAMAELEKATAKNVQERTRASSRKAKNLQPGDVVEWRDWERQKEITGWSMIDGEVLLSSNGDLWSMNGESRVRVYRRA